MSYCLNPKCLHPQNPDGNRFCQTCGSNLLLRERYRGIQLIGQGGFGRTFLAVDEDKPSKPHCVIKQFYPQAQGTDNVQKAARLFEQEAVRLDDLGYHPQIPELFAHFVQNNRQYLVQEYIPGYNLARMLRVQGAFSEQQIINLLNSLLPLLDFIHSHNVIHRDIKPENIICRSCSNFRGAKKKQLVLVDFGAAKFATITALTRKGTIIGSAGYAAPEQTLGQAFFASDLYSLGVTCIHLLTQRHPLELYCVNEGDWVWRDFLTTSISAELEQILDKLLQRPVRWRYQRAKEVLLDLNPDSTLTPNHYFTQIKTLTIPTLQHLISPKKRWECTHSLTGHSSSVCSVAISPEEDCIASASFDKTVKLWDIQTGEVLHTLIKHTKPVLSVVFRPDGRILASGSVDDTIELWHWQAGFVSCTIAAYSDARVSICLAISPDGQFLGSGSDGQMIKVWQIDTGRLLHTFHHSRGINSVTFSPDGRFLASGSSDNTVKLWRMDNGELVNTFIDHERDVNSVAIDPQGRLLASGSSDTTIKLWHLGNGNLLATLKGHGDWVRTVRFSSNGRILVSGSADATIKLWDLHGGKVVATLAGHIRDVNSIALSQDGQMIVSGSRDGQIKIWRYQ